MKPEFANPDGSACQAFRLTFFLFVPDEYKRDVLAGLGIATVQVSDDELLRRVGAARLKGATRNNIRIFLKSIDVPLEGLGVVEERILVQLMRSADLNLALTYGVEPSILPSAHFDRLGELSGAHGSGSDDYLDWTAEEGYLHPEIVEQIHTWFGRVDLPE